MGHVVDIGKPVNYTGGLEFSSLTYTVTKRTKDENGKWLSQEVDLLHQITGYAPRSCITAVMGPSGAGKSTLLDGLAGRIASGSLRGKVSMGGLDMSPRLIKRSSSYIMQDDRLFPMLTVYETFMFAADFRLGSLSRTEKQERVERLIEQLGLSSTRNTYIGDEGTRGISGGERRRVSIGVDIIHGPSLLFLDEPTSGLDSTSAHSVIEKVHAIARAGSTVILTIHQPSHRIQLLLDHLIILARGQLMYQGAPNDVSYHLVRMGRKLPKNESSIEHLIDVIQQYDQSELGVEAIAAFALTGMKPPPIGEAATEMSASTIPPSPAQPSRHAKHLVAEAHGRDKLTKCHRLQTGAQDDRGFDHSVRSPWNTSKSWSASRSGVLQSIGFSPARRNDHTSPSVMGSSPGCYAYSSEIIQSTPTPHSSDYTVNENDYLTPNDLAAHTNHSFHDLGPKFANSFFPETWILMKRNFINIMRTPELFLSRLVVLTAMGIMMATMFLHPKENLQGITNRLSLITYVPFLALQAAVYAVIVWFALSLRGPFIYFLVVLFMSLLSTNSFVIFVSAVVPNYILGYAAVIAFTALFFLFCGYFLDTDDMPKYWKWMNYVSTMTYPYEGLLMNQYQTNESFGKDPLGRDVTGFGILKSLNISQDTGKKWEKVYVMLGWAVFYRVLFYIALRFFSKNQRK
ncbi:unnamed protein product [Withania somnifera]